MGLMEQASVKNRGQEKIDLFGAKENNYFAWGFCTKPHAILNGFKVPEVLLLDSQ